MEDTYFVIQYSQGKYHSCYKNYADTKAEAMERYIDLKMNWNYKEVEVLRITDRCEWDGTLISHNVDVIAEERRSNSCLSIIRLLWGCV